MSAADLLSEVERYGGRLILDGENVKVRAPAPLPDELMGRLRQHKPELRRILADQATHPSRPKSPEIAPESPAENGSNTRVFAQSPQSPALSEENAVGRVLFTHYGAGYRHPDGRVETGAPEPAPRPTEAWPADLSVLLRRVATAFEWSDTDRRDFVAWARRSPEGLAEARAFLEAECQKLPAPGLSERRRVVVGMLNADPALRAAWTCADTGGDPVVLTLAVRGVGTCELAIPRAKFDEMALSLPGLIDGLAQ